MHTKIIEWLKKGETRKIEDFIYWNLRGSERRKVLFKVIEEVKKDKELMKKFFELVDNLVIWSRGGFDFEIVQEVTRVALKDLKLNWSILSSVYEYYPKLREEIAEEILREENLQKYCESDWFYGFLRMTAEHHPVKTLKALISIYERGKKIEKYWDALHEAFLRFFLVIEKFRRERVYEEYSDLELLSLFVYGDVKKAGKIKNLLKFFISEACSIETPQALNVAYYCLKSVPVAEVVEDLEKIYRNFLEKKMYSEHYLILKLICLKDPESSKKLVEKLISEEANKLMKKIEKELNLSLIHI